MKKTHKTRYTKQKMLAYYKEWQESGLGKKAYCQQKGLTASTFFYWLKKLALQKESFPPLPSQQALQNLLFLHLYRLLLIKYIPVKWYWK
jgi:hypothetical protein